MGLIIALDENNQAAGELFWDDGDSRGIVAFLISAVFSAGKCVGVLSLPLITGILFLPSNRRTYLS